MNPTFPRVTQATAEPATRALLDASAKRLGSLPRAHEVFANSQAFYSGYLTLFTNFMNDTSLANTERNVVFLTASWWNQCDYCLGVHEAGALNLGLDEDVISAIRTNTELSNPKLETLRVTVIAILTRHGQLEDQEVSRFLDAGYSHSQLLDVLLGVVSKVMSNYANLIARTDPE